MDPLYFGLLRLNIDIDSLIFGEGKNEERNYARKTSA